ncbi:MAG: S8 family serine peptidase [Saprospiraceae bacterium]|nr:S8 family serine peptidase [Saprospiraceae bacterium]
MRYCSSSIRGNSGNGCGSVSGPPAFFESSLSIGATDINGNIAGFSSRGPVMIDSSFRLKPNVSAPGVNVRSVIRGGSFAGFNGTVWQDTCGWYCCIDRFCKSCVGRQCGCNRRYHRRKCNSYSFRNEL